MPLIKRKPVELVLPALSQDYAPDQPVFYLKATGEVFLDYEDYVNRLTFYRQRIFQCELSGKINLTFFEAAKSERQQSAAVHRQFPEALKGPILKSVQFLVTGRIDNLVDLVYDRFKNRYFPNERLIVDIIGDKYFARVRGVFPHRSLLRRHQEAADARAAQLRAASSSVVKREGSESDSELSDAPPLDGVESKQVEVPVEEVIHAYGTDLNRDVSEVNKIDDPNDYIYAIQLEAPDGSSDFSNTLMEKRADSFSRDRLSFSKTILKKYIKECVVRDASIGSPWIVRPVLAQRYGIPTSPPADIARKNDLIREGKLNKRRKVVPEEEAEGKQKKRKKPGKIALTEEEAKAQAEREKELAEEEERRKAEEKRKRLIKYPIEDLLLDPISDRELKAKTKNPDDAPRRIERPVPSKTLLPAPKDIFESFMNSYLFLQACGKPLALSPFTLDDFEAALRHQTHDPACHLIAEVHGTLINAIVRENSDVKPPPAIAPAGAKGGAKAAAALPSDDEEFDEAENETDEEEEEEEMDELDSGASSIADTSVGDSAEDEKPEGKLDGEKTVGAEEGGKDAQEEDVYAASRKYGRGWDRKVLKFESFRDGWEYSLCGVLSKRGDATHFPRLLPILSQLSGVGKYTPSEVEEAEKLEQAEKQEQKESVDEAAYKPPMNGELYQTPVHRYTTLSFRDKVAIILFLCEQAVMSKGVKSFFDECEHNLTELRKEKVELSRARKKLLEDRAVFEGGSKKEDEAEGQEANGDGHAADGKGSDGEEDGDDEQSAGEEDELDSSAEADEEYESEANDSTATDDQPVRRSLGSRQEALRERALQREAEEAQRLADLAKAREEHKARLLENKQIASERKKLDDEELRIIRREEAIEREFRQYSQAPRLAPLGRDRYLDKYWWFDGVGLATLVNQYSQVTYSTGRLFVQAASAEEWSITCSTYEKGTRSLNERRKKEHTEAGILKPDEWAVYTEPEQIEELMAWLRAKGNREHALRSQMNRFRYYLAPGMQKRNHDLAGGWKDNVETRRSNRSKDGAGGSRQPYMLYRNALARGRD